MNDQRDELLREIGAALAIDPTPEFAARVRQEVRTHAPSSFRTWRLVAGAVGVLAVVASATLTIRHAPSPATTESVTLTQAPPAMLVANTEVSPPVERGPARLVRRPAAGQRLPPVIAAQEVDAFWRLVAAVQAEDVAMPPARWPISDVTGEIEPLPEIAAIEVPAVTIEPLPVREVDEKVGGTDD